MAPTHDVGVWSDELQITIGWEGAVDFGSGGLHGRCEVVHLGPFWVDDGSYIFADGFESGDLSEWTTP